MRVTRAEHSGRAALAAALAILVCAPSGAAALDLARREHGTLQLVGHHRLELLSLSSFPLDDAGLETGSSAASAFQHRLRLGALLSVGRWRVRAAADVAPVIHLYPWEARLGLPASASIRDQADGFSGISPRRLSVTWRSMLGRFTVGLTGDRWGLGLLANDGEGASWFAMPWYGDRVLRLGMDVTPLAFLLAHRVAQRLHLGAAFDLVFLDEQARLLAGDTALRGVFSLSYVGPRTFVGARVALRRQQDDGGTRLRTVALDLALEHRQPLGRRLLLTLAAEAVHVRGHTDRVRAAAHPDGLRVSTGAVVGRVSLSHPLIGLRLEGGWVSGDDDPDDGVVRHHALDPDYQPAMVLHRYLAAGVAAHGADRAGSPRRLERTIPGVDRQPAHGALSDTVYAQVALTFRPLWVVRWLRPLEYRVGVLYARAASDPVDPYNTWISGAGTTHLGRPAAGRRALGWELDMSLSHTFRPWRGLQLRLALLYGHVVPGAALDGAAGRRPVELLLGRSVFSF